MKRVRITPEGVTPYSDEENAAADVADAARAAQEAEEKPVRDRASRWEDIKRERERRRDGGVKVGAFWFHTDLPSRTQYGILDGKVTRANLPDAAVLHPKWKTMARQENGEPVFTAMTVGLLRQILDAGIVQESAVFDAAEAHRAAMEASEDPAAYDLSAGWPLSFGE